MNGKVNKLFISRKHLSKAALARRANRLSPLIAPAPALRRPPASN